MDYLCDCKADLYAKTETWLTEDDAAVRAELNLERVQFLRPLTGGSVWW